MESIGVLWNGLVTGLKRHSESPRRPRGGPNERALKAWLEQHMPETYDELKKMGRMNLLARLNALTGAGVRSCDTIEDGCARFQAALQDLTGEK